MPLLIVMLMIDLLGVVTTFLLYVADADRGGVLLIGSLVVWLVWLTWCLRPVRTKK